MKVTQALMVIMVAVAFIGGAMAAPLGKTVEYAGGPMGKVTFDGKAHADKGAKCNDCHTKIFKMKKGSTKITMATMNKGENCGTCHNGDKAFKSSDPKNCKTCHKK
jgi:c(7)-type cytochrome triheme protein